MAARARAAALGGAVGVRACGPDDVRAIRSATSLPIIGLAKVRGRRRFEITPTAALARELVDAGADLVAVDATAEVAGNALKGFAAVIAGAHVPVMADVSTFDEGLRALELGASVVGTTLSGYTPYTFVDSLSGPDIALVRQLAATGMRVFAEGRFRSPDDAAAALAAGAASVVVGGAITNPIETTSRFAAVWEKRMP